MFTKMEECMKLMKFVSSLGLMVVFFCVLFVSTNANEPPLLPPWSQTTIEYRPADNFQNFGAPHVFLEANMVVMAYQDGVLWAFYHRTGRLYSSTNQGGNWAFVYEFDQRIHAIHLDERGNIFVSTSADRWGYAPTGRIYRSDDGGATFVNVLYGMSGTAQHWNFASASRSESSQDGIMFVSEYGFKGHGDNARRIYRSLDFGKTWEIVFQPLPMYNYHLHKTLITPDGVVYQSVGDGIHAQIMRSLDDGETWHTRVQGLQPTSAIVFDTHILWGLDGGPWYGVARYCRVTGDVSTALSLPYPFSSSCYDMLYVGGIVYAMFLSYGRLDNPASIFYSKDQGITWQLMGYIEKTPRWGIGLYSIVTDGVYGYIFVSTIIIRDGVRVQGYHGTLRFELLLRDVEYSQAAQRKNAFRLQNDERRFCILYYCTSPITLDSVQTWKLLKKFHQNFIMGIYFLNHNPNIKVFVKLFSKSLQGVGRRPTVLRWRRVWDGVPRFYVGGTYRVQA